MKVDVETLSENMKKVRVEIPVDRIQQEFEKVYRELAQNAVIPGFRKGKIPRSMLKLRFGGDIEKQIGYELIEETLPDAMKKIEENIIGMPDLSEWSVEENRPFVYEAKFQIMPQLELKEYKNIEVPKQKIDIPEEQVQAGLERIRDNQATFEVVDDRAAENGDRIFGRITLKIDDEPLPGWTNRSLDIDLGKDTFFPGSGMEDQMIGAKTGQEHSFTVDIPEEYEWYKDVAGKTVTAVLKLDDIKTKVIPEINDDLAIDMGLETVDDLKKMVRDELEQKTSESVEQDFEQAMMTKICELNSVTVPDIMVENEAERIVDHYFQHQQSLTDDQKKQFAKSMTPMAEMTVKRRLVLDRIAALENLEVTEEDVNNAFREMAESADKDWEAIRAEWEQEDAVENLKRELARNKALEWLKENVVIIDPPPEKAPADNDTTPDANAAEASAEDIESEKE